MATDKRQRHTDSEDVVRRPAIPLFVTHVEWPLGVALRVGGIPYWQDVVTRT